MIDLDGDGLQDHVLRIPGYKTYWKRNKSGTYGQLCKIDVFYKIDSCCGYNIVYETEL